MATGFLDQTVPENGGLGSYKHTKFSLSYLPSHPGPGHLFLAMYDEWFKNMHNFDDYLISRNQLLSAHEPDDPLNNPYTWTHKQDGTPVWAIMAQDPEKIQTFQVGMSGIDVAIPVVGHFDFSTLAAGKEGEENETIQLVDVGGGHGTVLKQILDKHPELDPKKCVLQERPDVIEMAKKSGVLPEGTVFMEHDFRTEQPVTGQSPRPNFSLSSFCFTSFTLLLTRDPHSRSKSIPHAHDPTRLCRPSLHRYPHPTLEIHEPLLPRLDLRHGNPPACRRSRFRERSP